MRPKLHAVWLVAWILLQPISMQAQSPSVEPPVVKILNCLSNQASGECKISNRSRIALQIFLHDFDPINNIPGSDLIKPASLKAHGFYCSIKIVDAQGHEVPMKILQARSGVDLLKKCLYIDFELPDSQEHRLAKIRARVSKEYEEEKASGANPVRTRFIDSIGGVEALVKLAEEDYFENKPGQYQILVQYVSQQAAYNGELDAQPVSFTVVEIGNPLDHMDGR